MFGKAIWNKLPECIFENFETARVKKGRQFQNFQKSKFQKADLSQELPGPDMWL